MITMQLEEVYCYLRKKKYVSLATVDKDQPRVRTMAIVSYDNQFWAVTFKGTPKLAQIEDNPKFELSCDIHAEDDVGSIRGIGTIEVVEDLQIKERIAPSIWFLEKYFKTFDNPLFKLLKLNLTKFEVQSPITKKYHIFKVVTE